MPYRIDAYRNKKKVGTLRDNSGKILILDTRKEAVTTAHLESQQMESEGITYKIVKARKK